MLVRELTVQYRTRPDLPAFDARRILSKPKDAADFLRPILENEPVEVFLVLCLTTKHRIVAYHEVSRGTIDSTRVHPREVFKIALLANSAAIVLGHNHPSGDPDPSLDDLDLTARLLQAGGLLGIPVLDHIVIGHDGRYYSFKEGARL